MRQARVVEQNRALSLGRLQSLNCGTAIFASLGATFAIKSILAVKVVREGGRK